MCHLTKYSRLLICIPILFSPFSFAADEIETELSGFGRITMGYLDKSQVAYQDYTNELSIEPQSVLGLQGTAKYGDKLRVTALGMVSHELDWEANLEWLYVGYRPIKNLDLKFGRMHTPFYQISDSIDVGYSYHWVMPPPEVYRASQVPYFEGASIQYGFNLSDLFITTEAYYGSFDGDIRTGDTKQALDVEDLQGYILGIRWDNFTFRGSYHFADVSFDPPQQVAQLQAGLALEGYSQTAAALDSKGKPSFIQFGLNYHGLNYFAWAEWTKIDTEQSLYVGSEGQYIGFGRYIGAYTLFLTYAKLADQAPNKVTGEIPQSDTASFFGYQAVVDGLPRSDLESISLSARWEYSSQVAVKGEYKYLQESRDSSTAFDAAQGVDESGDSSLYLISLEWIF